MRAKVTATFMDGRTLEAEGAFAPLADRVAFEQRFGTSTQVLARLPELFGPDGLKPDADPGGFREEWIAFLIWRTLARAHQVGSFESFVAELEDVAIADLEDVAIADLETDARGEMPDPPVRVLPSGA